MAKKVKFNCKKMRLIAINSYICAHKYRENAFNYYTNYCNYSYLRRIDVDNNTYKERWKIPQFTRKWQ